MASLETLIQNALVFVRQLAKSAKPVEGTPRDMLSYTFSLKDYGTVSLSPDEAVKVDEHIRLLSNAVGKKISDRTLRDRMDHAIIKSLKALQTSKGEMESISKVAFDDLLREMSAGPRKWRCLVQLAGITNLTDEWAFHDVIILDDARGIVADIERVIEQTNDTDVKKDHFRKRINSEVFTEASARSFALVNVEAYDAQTAWVISQQKLSEVLDGLNFAIDQYYGSTPQRGVEMVPASGGVRSGILVDDSRLEASLQNIFTGRAEVNAGDFRALISDEQRMLKLLDLLGRPSPNDHQLRVLQSIRLAGRAAVEPSEREAFLNYVIALESMLLLKMIEKDAPSIGERLIHALKFIVGPYHLNPDRLKKEVNKLYDIRSKIVHKGRYELDQNQFQLLRRYVNVCLAAVVNDEPFARMTGETELPDLLEGERLKAAGADALAIGR